MRMIVKMLDNFVKPTNRKPPKTDLYTGSHNVLRPLDKKEEKRRKKAEKEWEKNVKY